MVWRLVQVVIVAELPKTMSPEGFYPVLLAIRVTMEAREPFLISCFRLEKRQKKRDAGPPRINKLSERCCKGDAASHPKQRMSKWRPYTRKELHRPRTRRPSTWNVFRHHLHSCLLNGVIHSALYVAGARPTCGIAKTDNRCRNFGDFFGKSTRMTRLMWCKHISDLLICFCILTSQTVRPFSK